MSVYVIYAGGGALLVAYLILGPAPSATHEMNVADGRPGRWWPLVLGGR